LLAVVALASLFAATRSWADAPAPNASLAVTISAIDQGGNRIAITWPGQSTPSSFAVPDAASWAALKSAGPGDTARVTVDRAAAPTKIIAINEVDRPVPFWQRVWTFAVVAIIALAVLFVTSRGDPRKFLIGKDGRYSNSQVQLALWFGVVAIVYGAAVWLRFEWLGGDFIGGVGLTTNLVALTGLSAFSFGGAKVITAQKVASAGQTGAGSSPPVAQSSPPVPAPKSPPPGGPNLITDLFQNDVGDADLGDLQMILVTVAAVAIFFTTSFHFLGSLQLISPVTLPDVDSALLAGFGIGQGAYLVKKAALPLGQG
jgi:hypothetical protein